MSPVSNVDRIMLILRQRLSDRAGTARKSGGSDTRSQTVGGRQAIAALAATEGIDERLLRRTLVQTLLVEQLGTALLNDVRFQEIVSQVSDALENDARGKALLDGLMNDIRKRP